MYQLKPNYVLRLADNAIIPPNDSNRDYQDYLAWVAAGNTPVPTPLSQLKAEALQALAAYRYDLEVAGTTWNGWPVATDRASQSSYNASYAMARDGYWTGGRKFADGVYRILTAEQVIALSLAVAQYVAGCFAREGELAAQINAATDAAGVTWTW